MIIIPIAIPGVGRMTAVVDHSPNRPEPFAFIVKIPGQLSLLTKRAPVGWGATIDVAIKSVSANW